MIRPRSLAFLVLLGAGWLFSAGAGEAIKAPAFELAGEVDGPMRGSQRNPAGAWNGEMFLVVWDDVRGESKDVYANRIDADGVPLEKGGFGITGADGSQRHPSVVAIADGQFLIAWEDRPTGHIKGNIVTRDGDVRYDEDFTIAENEHESKDIELADSPAGVMAVWEEHQPGGTRLFGRILDRSTGKPDPAYPVRQLSDQVEVQEPAVGSSDETFYVAWKGESDDHLYGLLVDPASWNAELSDPTFLGDLRNSGGDAEVVGNDDGFIVAWIRQFQDHFEPTDPADSLSIRVVAIDADGAVSDESNSSSLLLNQQYTTRISLSCARLEGDQYLIAWQHEKGGATILRGLEYSAAGGFTSEPLTLIEEFSDAQDPDLVVGGGRCLLTWEDRRHDRGVDENEEIFARFSPAGGFANLGSETMLTVATDTPLRTPLAVGSDGDGFYLVWRSESEMIADGVYGAHLDADGVLSPPAGHLLSTGAVNADVASDGDGYLVLWQGGTGLGWTAIPSDPRQLGQLRTRSMLNPRVPTTSISLASDGSSYAGVAVQPSHVAGESLLRVFTIVDEQEIGWLNPVNLETIQGENNYVEISGLDGEYALFWAEPSTMQAGTSDLRFHRVQRNNRGRLEEVEPNPVVIESGVAMALERGVRAASDGGAHRYYSIDEQLAVRSREVSPGGVLAEEESRETYDGESALPLQPAITCDGADVWFVSAWSQGGENRVRVSREQGADPKVFGMPECVLEFEALPLGITAGHNGTQLMMMTGFAESTPGAGDARLVGFSVALDPPQLRIEKTPSGFVLNLKGAPRRKYLRQESNDLRGWDGGVPWTTDADGAASFEIPSTEAGPRKHFRATSDFKD